MNHGTGWIVFEESAHSGNRKLLSILSPRRSRKHVAAYMQHCYVDRFASIDERLSFKKRPNSQFEVVVDRFGGVMHIGHDPFFVGIYSHRISLAGQELSFCYRIATNTNIEPPVYEERQQSLTVGT